MPVKSELTKSILTIARRLPEGWSVEILRMKEGPTLTLRAGSGEKVFSKAIALLDVAIELAIADLVELSWDEAERALSEAVAKEEACD